jgi:uncharacterized protein YdaU (DUF1376 family)
VNYYEHHIGDYAEATSHLTPLEDGVYSRLLRKYYSTEEPLPTDKKKLARWVGAVGNKDALAALDAVLDEFFVLQDDGYHNARCDQEILAYREGEPERDLKKANERNRLGNHRAERARLFKALTDAGGHAAWNIGIAELRSLVRSVAGVAGPVAETPQGVDLQRPVTPPATAPATPATATQTPDTRHQTPINQGATVVDQHGGPVGPARAGSENPDAGPGSGAAACAAMRQAGLADASATHPKLLALLAAGMTVAELEDAARVAAEGGKGFPWALARAEGQRRDAASVGVLPDAAPAVDPDSRVAVEADGVRFGLGRWEPVGDGGRSVPWSEYLGRVRLARERNAEVSP